MREAQCADWVAWNTGFKSSHLVGSRDQVLSALTVPVCFQITFLINPFLSAFAQTRSLSKPVALRSSAAKVRQAEGQFSVIPDPGSIFITLYTIHMYRHTEYVCIYVAFKVRVQLFVIFQINFRILWPRQVCQMKEGIIHSLLAGLTEDFLLPFECLVIGEQASAAQQRILKWLLVLFRWY